MLLCSQIRQGIAGNTKGTAFVVYEDVTDAKQACDKLNGFNFQSRYLVGKSCLMLETLSSPEIDEGGFHQGIWRWFEGMMSCLSKVHNSPVPSA